MSKATTQASIDIKENQTPYYDDFIGRMLKKLRKKFHSYIPRLVYS